MAARQRMQITLHGARLARTHLHSGNVGWITVSIVIHGVAAAARLV
ncbi:hypothetical protein [Humibacter sp.]